MAALTAAFTTERARHSCTGRPPAAAIRRCRSDRRRQRQQDRRRPILLDVAKRVVARLGASLRTTALPWTSCAANRDALRAHRGSSPIYSDSRPDRHNDRSDCLHYCQPGPVDWWSEDAPTAAALSSKNAATGYDWWQAAAWRFPSSDGYKTPREGAGRCRQKQSQAFGAVSSCLGLNEVQRASRGVEYWVSQSFVALQIVHLHLRCTLTFMPGGSLLRACVSSLVVGLI